MGRKDLVHLDDLVYSVSVTTLIVERLDRIGNLTLLQVADGGIVLGLQLVDLEIDEPVLGSAIWPPFVLVAGSSE